MDLYDIIHVPAEDEKPEYWQVFDGLRFHRCKTEEEAQDLAKEILDEAEEIRRHNRHYSGSWRYL